MKNQEENIDRLIFEKMDQEEKSKFIANMESDPELKREFMENKFVINALEAKGRQYLLQELKTIHTEVVVGNKKKPNRIYLFVILLLILIISSIWIYQINKKSNPEQIYYAFYQPYELSLNQRNNGSEMLIKIEQSYNNENYTKAISLLSEELNNQTQKSPQLIMALATSHLENGNSSESIRILLDLKSKGNFNFENEIDWYLALSYLKSNDLRKTKEILVSIVKDQNNDYYEEATTILKRLK